MAGLFGSRPGPYQFSADGRITGGLIEGMQLDIDPLRKSLFESWKSDPSNVLYGSEYQDPYAKGGQINGLKFGTDGKLYGEIGGSIVPIIGWEFDTSTLPKPVARGHPLSQSAVNRLNTEPQPVSFYDAKVLPSEGGHLIEVAHGGNILGWARQRLQFAIEADSKKPGAGSKRTQTLGDTRVSNPGQNR